jgi:hypothetical protein
MPRYLVVVERTELSYARVEVEAEDSKNAKELALEECEYNDVRFGEREVECFDAQEAECIKPP